VAFLFSPAHNGVADICAGSSEVKKKIIGTVAKNGKFRHSLDSYFFVGWRGRERK
jgi:hypothetical protein